MAAQLEETNELETWLLSNNINDSVLLEALNNEEIETVDDLLLFENNDIKQVLLTKVKMGKIAKLLRALNQHRANNTQQPSEQKNQTNDEIKSNEELKANDTINLVTNDKDFIYESDFDTNGIIYYLGTNFGSEIFKNPSLCERNLINIKGAKKETLQSWKHLLNFERRLCRGFYIDSNFNENEYGNAWLMVDFGNNLLIKPTHYTIDHCDKLDFEMMKNWNLEGSIDGIKWNVIYKHENDEWIDKSKFAKTWKLNTDNYYNKFRIIITDKSDTKYRSSLRIRRIEFYGHVKGEYRICSDNNDEKTELQWSKWKVYSTRKNAMKNECMVPNLRLKTDYQFQIEYLYLKPFPCLVSSNMSSIVNACKPIGKEMECKLEFHCGLGGKSFNGAGKYLLNDSRDWNYGSKPNKYFDIHKKDGIDWIIFKIINQKRIYPTRVMLRCCGVTNDVKDWKCYLCHVNNEK
eukprot:250369_1